MSKNKKIIIVSMMAVMISALVSIILVNKLSLKKPVFLMNYREIAVNEDNGKYFNSGSFNLEYISSTHDTRKIDKLTFKEMPNTKFTIYDDDSNFFFSKKQTKSGIYTKQSIELICYDLKDMSDDKKIVTKADIEFDDGSTLEVDLGKIIFYEGSMEKSNVERLGGGSSSDGTAYSQFRANEDLKIEKIESYFDDEIDGVFSFSINSEVFDEEKGTFINQEESLKKDSIITFRSEYINNDILNKYTIYDIEPKIYFINNENLRYVVRCNNISNKNYNSDNDLEIYMYLKARGEL